MLSETGATWLSGVRSTAPALLLGILRTMTSFQFSMAVVRITSADLIGVP
jgi:hypothetical protein